MATSDPLRAALPQGIIGVVHLQALPGDPRGRSIAEVREHALADARAIQEGGASALIVENFGSSPFVKGTQRDPLPPHQVAQMTSIAESIAREVKIPIGINCLRNDAIAALAIASVIEAAFVRVNIHVGAYVTDQGVIEGEAARSLRYRAQLGAPIPICADVAVKHASPLGGLDLAQATKDLLSRGHAAAVIVSGSGTGAAVDLGELRCVRAAAKEAPVWIGSGLTSENAATLLPWVDAAVVGTATKVGGELHAPVDADRVSNIVQLWQDFHRT